MINVSKILEKYGVVKSPISGLETYTKGTILEFSEELIKAVLKQAAANAKTKCLNMDSFGINKSSSCSECEYHILDKQSILDVIKEIEF